jgi:hypothetical protein
MSVRRGGWNYATPFYRSSAAQLLQEIDKAALVCPCRYRGTRAIHARRAARRPQFGAQDRQAACRGLRRCA